MKKTHRIIAAVLALSISFHTLAASFSRGGSSSFSRSSSSLSSYRPSTPAYRAPVAPPRTVVHNTTVVQQTVQKSGGGFFSSVLGGVAGYGIGHMLFGSSNQQPAPAAPPIKPSPVDCTVKPLPAEWLPFCPQK